MTNTNTLVKGLTTKDSYTENGMLTNSTTSDATVDLFASIGAMRTVNKSMIEDKFSRAYNADPNIAMKILFWARDVREGAGERKVFRTICDWLAVHHESSLIKNLKHISTFGRYDDLISIYENTNNSIIKKEILKILGNALNDKDGLCAKWMPRKGFLAKQFRESFGLTPKKYRKLLVETTNVVETQMCAKEWDSINFNHVPSLAMSRYKKAFAKNSQLTFKQWVEDLKSNKSGTKVNASAVYPYDIMKSLENSNKKSEKDLANEQWKALPNWVPNTEFRIMPVVDVSGSMTWDSPISGTIYPIHVAVSLGLYFSERNLGPYKDNTITFSDNPEFNSLSGTLEQRISQLRQAKWGGSTNLEGVFRLILNTAITNHVQEEDMPTHIIIFSDMEFNSCTTMSRNKYGLTAIEMIRKYYNNAGYKMPKVIFWQIKKAQSGNYTVKFDEAGTALVSGFSPSIIKNLVDFISPMHAMLRVVANDRYKEIEA